MLNQQLTKKNTNQTIKISLCAIPDAKIIKLALADHGLGRARRDTRSLHRAHYSPAILTIHPSPTSVGGVRHQRDGYADVSDVELEEKSAHVLRAAAYLLLDVGDGNSLNNLYITS